MACQHPNCDGQTCECTRAPYCAVSRAIPVKGSADCASLGRTTQTQPLPPCASWEDAAHEVAIQAARLEFERLHALCESDAHVPADIDRMQLAHGKWLALLRERSPQQNACMLAAQAVAMAREPGARH